MKKIGFAVTLFLVLGLVLAACAAPQKPAPVPEKPAAASPAPTLPQLTREQQLVEGAKKEGVVVYWMHTGRGLEQALKLFKEKYPFLEVKTFDAARGPEIVTRITEESKAGRYSVDLIST